MKLDKLTNCRICYVEGKNVVVIEGDERHLQHIDVSVLTHKELKGMLEQQISDIKSHIKEVRCKLDEMKSEPPFLDEHGEQFGEEVIQRKRILIEELQNHIKRLSFVGKFNKDDNQFYLEKENAKKVPISNFVKFNRAGFSKCLWHEDKTPSLRYYDDTNTVYCFGCHAKHDVIGVVMKEFNIDFKQALVLLSQ